MGSHTWKLQLLVNLVHVQLVPLHSPSYQFNYQSWLVDVLTLPGSREIGLKYSISLTDNMTCHLCSSICRSG